jgi:hypothetical protein
LFRKAKLQHSQPCQTGVGIDSPCLSSLAIPQAVLDSFDAGYHNVPNPYKDADKALVMQHDERRKMETILLAQDAASSDAADPSAMKQQQQASSKCKSTAVMMARGGRAAGKLPADALASKLKMLQSMPPLLCFVSWELHPIGVISDKWI